MENPTFKNIWAVQIGLDRHKKGKMLDGYEEKIFGKN